MHAHEPAKKDRQPQPATRGTAARPGQAPGGHPPEALLELQRTAGNAAAVRMLQRNRHRHTAAQPAQPSTVHDVLRAPGKPLDGALRRETESRLGADFFDVRLHTGSAARDSAAEVGARAHTSGSHAVIGDGDGDGGGDKHTLAHEPAHVIRQRQGPVAGTDNRAGPSVSHPGDRYEREAEADAAREMNGRPEHAAPVQRQTGARARGTAHGHTGTAVQRFAEADTAELGPVRV